jgi:hypothetical protein
MDPQSQAALDGLTALGDPLPEASLGSSDPTPAIHQLLDNLGARYLVVSDQLRAEIRAQVSQLKVADGYALLRHASERSERLKADHDPRWLSLGLASVSIDDCRIDARESLAALGDLWLAARQVDLDPGPTFLRVAAMSSREPSAGGFAGGSTAHLIAAFERSAYLRELERRT